MCKSKVAEDSSCFLECPPLYAAREVGRGARYAMGIFRTSSVWVCVCAGLREYMRFEGLCYSIDTNFSTCVCARVRLHRVVRVFWSAYLSLSPERCDMSLGLFEQC